MPALKGVGLLKGLGVTLKTMTRPAATRQYPHVKPDLPARSRGVIALIEENCTVCMLCARECPDWCIYIDSHKEQVAPKEGGRARTRNLLDRFAIDFALCMYCGICVEVCPFDALHWSPEFEYAEHQIEKLTHEMDTLRTWAYSVPAPDPLEEGAIEPKEIESARKAREAVAAKAAAAAEQARAAAPPVPAPAAAATQPAAATTTGAAAGTATTTPTAATATPVAGDVAPAASAGAAGAGTTTAAARPADVEVEPGIDQATYDRLLAAGESDRTARAKAKAAYMRRAKAEARAAQAAGAPEAAPAPATPAEAAAPPVTPEGAAAPAAEPASVETPAAATAAPETAPPAPSAVGTPEAAEPAADARAPDARSPEGDPTASGTAAEVVAPGAAVAQADAEHLEIEVDQETYDRLIEAGEPERTARAKAKAAYARKLRAAQRDGGGAGS
jgi:formate hydrogenlyase subunit 6/NADH:ubiquinone oxidoreductase subunit I